MKNVCALLMLSSLSLGLSSANASDISNSIAKDYQQHLAPLWDHFHRNPELSLMEHNTAKRLAQEIRAVGYTVTEGIGGTGIVAILKNGPGPMVMVRADMDGLPVKELSGLKNASQAVMTDWDGNEVGVMHACGHDVHITSLVGTARYSLNKRTMVRYVNVNRPACRRKRPRSFSHDGGWYLAKIWPTRLRPCLSCRC